MVYEIMNTFYFSFFSRRIISSIIFIYTCFSSIIHIYTFILNLNSTNDILEIKFHGLKWELLVFMLESPTLKHIIHVCLIA